MKRLLTLLIAILCLYSCTSTTPTVKEEVSSKPVQPPPQQSVPEEPLAPLPCVPKELLPVPVQTVEQLDEKEGKKSETQEAEFLFDVSISTTSFNPQKGEEVAIYYTLSKRAEVEVAFYDPDFTLVKSSKSTGMLEVGKHTLIWDGRDLDRNIVPDEAYFFTISAKDEKGNMEVYDPTTFSGGEGHDITEADIDPDTKIITYKLPSMARVLIRLGVQDGPLLSTLVDWRPRVSGQITEYWNGMDEDGVIDLINHPRFKMLITYFTLPEHSIITYGNNDLDYRKYKNSLETQRPVKERPIKEDATISPHYQLPRTVDYSPNLKLRFSNIKGYDQGNIPLLRGKTLVTVEIDEMDKSFFVNQQYEITLFLDTEFYMEQELGYVPFNWVWDLSDVDEGEHVLTVNMSGFKGQIGVLSKRIKIIK